MKMNIRHIAMAMVAGLWLPVGAQELQTAYFSDSYLYRHDLNPAFDNENSYFSIPFVGNLNVGIASNFRYDDVVRDNPLYPDRSSKKKTTFMNPYLSNGLKGFSSGDNVMNGALKMNIMSVGFKKWGGYNTIELNARAKANTSIPYKLFEFAVNADNRHFDIGDVSADVQGFVELSMGHSRQVDEKLRLGGKVKLLVGAGNASVELKNVVADLQDANKWTVSADAKSQVSMKGFKYLSNTKEYHSKDGTYKYIDDVDVDGGGPSGFGAAIDFGAVYKLNDDVTLSAAIQDLGAVLWSNNYVGVNDAKSFTFDGFHDVSIDSQSGNVLDDQADKYTDQLLDFAHLRDKGDDGARVTGIGANVNLGLQYVVPTFDMLRLGLLGTAHIDGPYSWTEGRLSANIAPIKWFDASVSLAVNTFNTSLGFLANIHTKGFNFFLGMDHLMGTVSKEGIPLSGNGQVALGFNVIL